MQKVTPSSLAQAFFESLGNQGAPVVDEILENFTDSMVSLTLGNGESVEFFLDVENITKTTATALIASLDEKKVPYRSHRDSAREYISWNVENVEYKVGFSPSGKIYVFDFKFYPRKEIKIWYTQQNPCELRITSTEINGKEVPSNFGEECFRLLGDVPW